VVPNPDCVLLLQCVKGSCVYRLVFALPCAFANWLPTGKAASLPAVHLHGFASTSMEIVVSSTCCELHLLQRVLLNLHLPLPPPPPSGGVWRGL
jgi:hypothetical protein